jgi:heme-degrading monooxygenase HmoA
MPALPWTTRTTPQPDATYTVMGSRLPLRGYRFIPRFLAHTMKIRRQLAHADGLVGYALDARLLHKEFLTVSVWESKEHLERFARADPHAGITRTKHQRMGPSRFVFWTVTGADVPVPWDGVRARLHAGSSPPEVAEPA